MESENSRKRWKNIMKKMIMLLSMLTLAACSQQAIQSEEEANIQESSQVQEYTNSIVENTSVSTENQEAIISVYESFQDALVNKDMDALDKLLPDDYTAVHITGRRQTKEEWLADIENGDMVYYEFLDVSYAFSQNGNQVTVSINQRIHANIYGSEGTWSIPGERIFEKVNGEWVIRA